MTTQSEVISPVSQEVKDEFGRVITAFHKELPANPLAFSQFLRRQASRVEASVTSESALEAQGQASLATRWCDPKE